MQSLLLFGSAAHVNRRKQQELRCHLAYHRMLRGADNIAFECLPRQGPFCLLAGVAHPCCTSTQAPGRPPSAPASHGSWQLTL